MKRLVPLILLALVSCHQIDVPYPTSCHNAIRFSVEPRYYCRWQNLWGDDYEEVTKCELAKCTALVGGVGDVRFSSRRPPWLWRL